MRHGYLRRIAVELGVALDHEHAEILDVSLERAADVPTLNIETDYDRQRHRSYTTFVFLPNIGSVVNGAWQTWDATNPADGTWYSTADTGAGTALQLRVPGPAASTRGTRSRPATRDARVKYGLGPNIGTGGTFAGNVDKLTVEASGNTTIFDFEPGCTHQLLRQRGHR